MPARLRAPAWKTPLYNLENPPERTQAHNRAGRAGVPPETGRTASAKAGEVSAGLPAVVLREYNPSEGSSQEVFMTFAQGGEENGENIQYRHRKKGLSGRHQDRQGRHGRLDQQDVHGSHGHR